jgi:hypothetical protein
VPPALPGTRLWFGPVDHGAESDRELDLVDPNPPSVETVRLELAGHDAPPDLLDRHEREAGGLFDG